MIEIGRFLNIKPEERICPICKTGAEDETHFFLEYIQYKEQRDDFLKYFENMDLNKMTNTQKLNTLLNLDNKDDLLIVGSYLKNMAASKGILGEEIILFYSILFYPCVTMYLGTIYVSTKFRPDRTSNMAARWPSWKKNKVLLLLN
jgi:hypothetical protein